MQVIVIGGGISGLTCAYRLQRAGHHVTLLEQSAQVGGVIDSVRQDGFLFELGPQSFLSSKAVLELIDDLGLTANLQQADRRAPRYILVGGRLHQVPMAPPHLLTSSLLSWGTKMRLLSEPFRRSVPPEADESVAAFVRRKFGEELLKLLVGPLVSGIYAGDPERLSLRSTFSVAHEWEKKYGSVIRGAMKAKPAAGQPRPTLCSFTDGVRALPDGLAAKLGGALRTRAVVLAVRRQQTNGAAGFEVDADLDGRPQKFLPKVVVLATPTPVTAKFVTPLSAKASEALGGIEYAPVAVVNAGYRRADVNHPMSGFGYLVPRSEGVRSLGCVWSSSLFPGRAPERMVSTATFVGGATDPAALAMSDSDLSALVESETARPLGITAPPVTRSVKTYARAIPQYNLGHAKLLEAVHGGLAQIPGLFLTGSYFEGPAIAACVEHATKTATAVCDFLKQRKSS